MPKCQVSESRTLRGNNVPNSNKKTRKTIKNSVTDRRYFSSILGYFLTIKCTKRAGDTIIKFGGIDCYLVNSKTSKLSSEMLSIRKTLQKCIVRKNLTNISVEQIQIEAK